MNLIPPNESQLECLKAETFYRTAEMIDEDVTRLIEWLSKQPHLPNITDRKWLSHFIMGCKNNFHRSKQVIESYFVVRAMNPQFLGSFTQELIEKFFEFGTLGMFPKLTPEGYRIFYLKINPSKTIDVNLFCKVTLAFMDLTMKQEPMLGNIALYDLKHIQLSQFLSFTPTVTKNMMKCLVSAFPQRLKRIHFINPPTFMSRIEIFFKMLLPKKIKDRFIVHSSLEYLQQYIPKDVLPVTYNGTEKPVEFYDEEMFKILLANNDWLEARPKADLSKLPEHQANTMEDYNMTFRTLEVD